MKKFKSVFYCYVHICSIFDAAFCYLVEYPIHAFSEQVKCYFFLQCFDNLVGQQKK